MPLRDHFHSPVDDLHHWEGFYGQWPAMIVQGLSRTLPDHYAAAPCVYSSPCEEIRIEAGQRLVNEYEVRVCDRKRDRRLVAAVEIVSPANKYRPDHRRAFAARCAALLQDRVSVMIVDLVTTCQFNLYCEMLKLIGTADPSLGAEPRALYALACRATKKGEAWTLETWLHTLTLGQPLPTLPLWLADNLAVPLELEASYEETCQVLRIP